MYTQRDLNFSYVFSEKLRIDSSNQYGRFVSLQGTIRLIAKLTYS